LLSFGPCLAGKGGSAGRGAASQEIAGKISVVRWGGRLSGEYDGIMRAPENEPRRGDGLLHYGRHFVLVAAVAAVLAATGSWRPALGVVGWFGVYGALHSSMIVLTWRGRSASMRRVVFICVATGLSMLSGLAGLYARRLGWSWGTGPAVPLGICSSLGAATYVALLFGMRAPLRLRSFVTLPLGCVLATLAVLGSGVYRFGGTWWFAVAWWYAFSLGLWLEDRQRRPAEF
jgi:hypothetical protein